MGADYKRTNEAATNWHKVAGGVAWTDIGDSGTVPPRIRPVTAIRNIRVGYVFVR